MENKNIKGGPVHYVLGLCFSKTGNQMAAVLKDRPEFQKGKWNGIGGKVDLSDLPRFINEGNPEVNAMIREFKEETGCATDRKTWDYFAKVKIEKDKLGGRAIIHCFRRFDNDVFDCQTMETEKIEIHTVADLCNKLPVAPNLPMLINCALNKNINFIEINSKS